MSSQKPCIWCLSASYKPSLEHIVPDAIGCPEGFVLRDGVCAACNNGLGHLDQALLRQFEVQAFLCGIPRKGGRRPSLESWAGLAGRWTPDGPELHLNAGPDAQEAYGRRLSPASASTGIRDASVKVDGAEATTRFSMAFGADPKFTRAIYKIALGTVAYFLGVEAAASTPFDPVRAFVRKGEGPFRVLLLSEVGEIASQVSPPWSHPDGMSVPMTLLGVDLIADLDPAQRGINKLVDHLSAGEVQYGWWLLPLP